MEHVKVKGTFYSVGKQLGELKADTVRSLLKHFKESDLHAKVNNLLGTEDGRRILKTFRETTQTHCGDYIDEMRGLAEGAGVEFDDVFLLNLDTEFIALLDVVPPGGHGTMYGSYYGNGCTSLFIQTNNKSAYIVHSEDGIASMKEGGIIVTAEIVDERGTLLEGWTEYVYPGIIGGSKFGFNMHGLLYVGNCVYPEFCNLNGIPRKFICRRVLAARSASEAAILLKKSPGIATGFMFTFIDKSEVHRMVCTSVEVTGCDAGSDIAVQEIAGMYSKCNIFQHLPAKCHPDESSIHRMSTILHYINTGRYKTIGDLKDLISDSRDSEFPVYRNGKEPDYLTTAAIVIFSTSDGHMEVYTKKPSHASPDIVLELPGYKHSFLDTE